MQTGVVGVASFFTGIAVASYAYNKKANQTAQVVSVPAPVSIPQQTPQPIPKIIPAQPKTQELTVAHPVAKYGVPTGEQGVIYRDFYGMRYNRQTKNADWVIEHLTKTEFDESISRHNTTFQEDPSIPEAFRAKLSDYEKSGFDRGHLIPAANARTSQHAMNETFYLGNVSPQNPSFNRGYWARLERFVRHLTRNYPDVYVVTGPLFLPQPAEDGKSYVKYQVLGNPPNTAVPTHYFKVILAVDEPSARFALGSFVLPNDKISHSTPIESFSVPLSFIEKNSGYTFFPILRQMLQNNDSFKWKPLCSDTSCILPPNYVPPNKNQNNNRNKQSDSEE